MLRQQLCISLTWLLLSQLIADGSAVTVYGYAGQSVTLPCKYDAKYYGALSICWGKGSLPSRGCGDQVIKTEGLRVTERSSSRYQLINRNSDVGDVSLTITVAREQDSGTYGCRVDIPGWFNDEKYHVDLRIQAAPTTTTTTSSSATEVPTTTLETTTLKTTVATTTTELMTTDIATEEIWIIFQDSTTQLPSSTQVATTPEPTTNATIGQSSDAEHSITQRSKVTDFSPAEPSSTPTEPEQTREETSWQDPIYLTTHENAMVSTEDAPEMREVEGRDRAMWWIMPVLGVLIIASVIGLTTMIVKRKQLKMGTFTILEKSVNETLSTNSGSSQGPPSSEISMDIIDSLHHPL